MRLSIDSNKPPSLGLAWKLLAMIFTALTKKPELRGPRKEKQMKSILAGIVLFGVMIFGATAQTLVVSVNTPAVSVDASGYLRGGTLRLTLLDAWPCCSAPTLSVSLSGSYQFSVRASNRPVVGIRDDGGNRVNFPVGIDLFPDHIEFKLPAGGYVNYAAGTTITIAGFTVYGTPRPGDKVQVTVSSDSSDMTFTTLGEVTILRVSAAAPVM